MAKLFNTEMVEYLREIAPGRFTNELTKMMNDKFGTDFTQAQITNLKSRRGIRSDVLGIPKEVSDANRITTPEMDEFIKGNQKGLFASELAELVNERFDTNFTKIQMGSYRNRNNLDSGLTGQFEQGQGAWNKGLKQSDYMNAEAIERTKATRFVKGQMPNNLRPIGYERITVDGYLEVKVRDKGKLENFELKNRLVWEGHHGKIPESHVVMFKDGDRLNCDIDNLMLVSRGQLAVFNSQYKRSGSPMLDEVTLNKIKLDLMQGEIKRGKHQNASN